MENGIDLGINFRDITQKDHKLLEKWYGLTQYFGYATGFKDFSEILRIISQPDRPDRIIRLIGTEKNGRTIGFIYAEVKSREPKPILWIYILIIDPAFQKKGFGTKTVNKLLNSVKGQYGSLTCIAAVSDKNRKGLSFWQKAGFMRSSDMEKYLGHIGSPHVAILFKEI